MSTGSRNDPQTTYRFGVKINDGPVQLDYSSSAGHFSSVTGLKSESEVLEMREGGVMTANRKLIGGTKHVNIVLKRAFTGDSTLVKWFMSMRRVNGQIVQLSSDGAVTGTWTFVRGFPVKYDGPDLDGTKNEVAMETIEISHEGLFFGKLPKDEPQPTPPINATVNFDFDKDNVKENAEIKAVAEDLKANPNKKVKIEAHTDSIGTDEYNMDLSKRRAASTKQYLLSQGVKPDQIVSADGFGESRPIADNATPAGRAQNRRCTVTQV